jgi:hypothetical protein
MFGMRRVRWANIDKDLRDICERYGESVMQAFITAPQARRRGICRKSTSSQQRFRPLPNG